MANAEKQNIALSKKLLRFIKYSIALLLIIIALHFNFYFALKKEFNADKSVNPEATAFFMHATAVNIVWTGFFHEILHLDYDNILLKPFMSLRDYFFEKGEELTLPDNPEDGLWWVQNYAAMYGIIKSDKFNNGLRFVRIDSTKKNRIKNKVFEYVEKLEKNDIRGINSQKYDSQTRDMRFFISILVTPEISFKDTNALIMFRRIYESYNGFMARHGNDEETYLIAYNKFRILRIILMCEIEQGQLYCDKDVKEFRKTYDFLTQWALSPESDKDIDSKRHKALFIEMADTKDKNSIARIINENINKKCPQSKLLK